MNVLLIGKTGSIIRWIEDMAADLRHSGHTVSILPTRNPLLSKSVERFLLSPVIGAPLAALKARRARHLAPDLILAIGAFDHTPPIILEYLRQIPGRPPLVAWIGDVFTEQVRTVANMFDLVAYTDSGLVDLHDRLGLLPGKAFVPLAATRAFKSAARIPERIARLAFVAAPTPNRRDLLATVTEPVAVFGPGWQRENGVEHHDVEARRIDADELSAIYARHLGALNVRHGRNVINGLNQRHFAPCIQAAAIVTDPQSDIQYCFEIGTELLVYRAAAELDALCSELRRHPERAREVGLAGQRRVLAHHTYEHRLNTIARLCGAVS